MIIPVMKSRKFAAIGLSIGLALACAALPASGQKKPQQQVKPMAGPRAAALRVSWLYVSPDTGSQKVAKVLIGREMVVAEKSGPWLRVYANTDIEEQHNDRDTPMVGTDETPPPIKLGMMIKYLAGSRARSGPVSAASHDTWSPLYQVGSTTTLSRLGDSVPSVL